MEYLMTYGWAILVVIIVGIVLWQSGVFGTGSGGVSGFDKVRVRDYTYSVTGFQVKMENAAGGTIKDVLVTTSTDGGTTWTANVNNSLNWAPGKEYAVTNNSTMAGCPSAGAGYNLDVKVVYTAESGVAHTETGTIRGKCE